MYGGGKSEEFLGAALQDGRRDDAVIATQVPAPPEGRGYSPGCAGHSHPRGVRGQPAPAAHRSHRPLLPALPRPRGAGRRGARDARRHWSTRARCSTSPRRTSMPIRSAPPMRRPPAHPPAPGSAARSSNGTCCREMPRWRRTGRRRARARDHPVLPAGVRHAHRQVPARRSLPARTPASARSASSVADAIR